MLAAVCSKSLSPPPSDLVATLAAPMPARVVRGNMKRGGNRTKESSVMNKSTFGRSFISTAATLIVAAGTMLFASLAAAAPDGTIDLTLYKAGFIVGGSGGSGTLKFKGKQYPVEIGGVSLGATIGASKAELIGEVYNLKSPGDIEGTYAAVQAGVAVVGGGKVKGKEVGLELALDLSGMGVSLKK
jgi:hypothetical protein